MVSKCANPSCSATFRYYHEGKLYAVQPAEPAVGALDEHQARGGVHYLWLCDVCCQRLTVAPGGALIARSSNPMNRTAGPAFVPADTTAGSGQAGQARPLPEAGD